MAQKLNLFISNLKEIENEFIWQRGTLTKLTALLFTLEDKQASGNAVKEARELIKENIGFFSFSYFKGHMNLCVAAILAMAENPQKLLDNTLAVYEMLKNEKFKASDYLAIAALQIAANTEEEKLQLAAERAHSFYDGMKCNHWFITGQDDYIYAAMLALSDIDPETGSVQIEEMYNRIKEDFPQRNSAQSLAEILVLGGQSVNTVERVYDLSRAFRAQGIKMDKTYTLPVLGVLTLLPVDSDLIIGEIEKVKEYLKGQKGFGIFSVDGQELLLFTAALVTSYYAEELKHKMTATLATSITGILIAQQAAVYAALAASSAAANAASN